MADEMNTDKEMVRQGLMASEHEKVFMEKKNKSTV
jgi:hypothetical protein